MKQVSGGRGSITNSIPDNCWVLFAQTEWHNIGTTLIKSIICWAPKHEEFAWGSYFLWSIFIMDVIIMDMSLSWIPFMKLWIMKSDWILLLRIWQNSIEDTIELLKTIVYFHEFKIYPMFHLFWKIHILKDDSLWPNDAIWIIELGRHWFRQWLVDSIMPLPGPLNVD